MLLYVRPLWAEAVLLRPDPVLSVFVWRVLLLLLVRLVEGETVLLRPVLDLLVFAVLWLLAPLFRVVEREVGRLAGLAVSAAAGEKSNKAANLSRPRMAINSLP